VPGEGSDNAGRQGDLPALAALWRVGDESSSVPRGAGRCPHAARRSPSMSAILQRAFDDPCRAVARIALISSMLGGSSTKRSAEGGVTNSVTSRSIGPRLSADPKAALRIAWSFLTVLRDKGLTGSVGQP